MTEAPNDTKKPFAFWLVETFLPDDDVTPDPEMISDSHFCFILAAAAVLTIVLPILVRAWIV